MQRQDKAVCWQLKTTCGLVLVWATTRGEARKKATRMGVRVLSARRLADQVASN